MEPEVSDILPGLYLGSLSGLRHLEALAITHILSVVNFPLQKDLSNYVTLQLPLQDSEGVNMLQYLPAAIKFLDAALGEAASARSGQEAAPPCEQAAADDPSSNTTEDCAGAREDVASGPPPEVRVLVHCQAGVSRSAAVTAAWLMRSRGMTADQALAFLRARRPVVDPNEGFRAQLALFEDMRCRLDASHPVYRMWCLEELASRYEEQGYVDPLVFGQLPEGPAGLSAAVAARQTLYRCRKCRQLLATSEHVVPVEAAMGHRTFRRRRHLPSMQSDASGDGGAESCLFVEPMQWMAGSITGVVAGKLHCPKCAARLGSFNWSGISNPSGAWVTPAFQLHLSKMDVVEPKPLAAIANVRQPLLSRGRPSMAPGAEGSTEAVHAGSVPVMAPAVVSAAPSLPATLPAAIRRMGLGRAGAGFDEEADEEQLPEPQLALGDGDADAAGVSGQPRNGTARADAATGTPGEADASTDDGASAGPAAEVAQGTLGAAAGGEGQTGLPTPCAACNGSGASGVTESGSGSNGEVGAPPAADGPAGPAAACQAAWFTHLILDCDGVMVDSEAASCEALRRAILEVTGFDIPHSFPQDYVEVFGMDVRSCVAHYRERFDRTDWDSPEALAPRVQAAKELHYKQLTAEGICAFDGAERLIRRALEAGLKVGVASSGAPEKIAHNLSSSGLAPLVPPHAIVSASHVAAGKPAPDVYLAAMKVTGCLDSRRALVVEDAVNGLKAARAAGMFTVGITNQLPAAVLAPWADLVVSHLDEVDPIGLVPTSAPSPAVTSGSA